MTEHLMINAVTGEEHVIQLKLKPGISDAEAQAFRAGSIQEGKRINPHTCLTMRVAVEAVDVYGLHEVPAEWSCTGKERFVRMPDGDWVWEGDLPEEIAKALHDRLERAWADNLRFDGTKE